MSQLPPNKLVLKLLFVYWSILGISLMPYKTQAHPLNTNAGGNDTLLSAQNDDFDFIGDGRSGHRNGGGSRSDCPSVDVPLTALIPISNFGQAIATPPQFWFYIPYTTEEAPVGEFIIQDVDRNDIYRGTVTLHDTPGFTSVTLPQTAPELSLNQEYRWYFNIYCDAEKASSPIFLQGWIQRINSTPALEAQLASTPDRAGLVYARNRIWFDAIASLAENRRTNPTDSDLIADWNALLNARGVNLNLPDSLPFAGSAILTEELD